MSRMTVLEIVERRMRAVWWGPRISESRGERRRVVPCGRQPGGMPTSCQRVVREAWKEWHGVAPGEAGFSSGKLRREEAWLVERGLGQGLRWRRHAVPPWHSGRSPVPSWCAASRAARATCCIFSGVGCVCAGECSRLRMSVSVSRTPTPDHWQSLVALDEAFLCRFKKNVGQGLALSCCCDPCPLWLLPRPGLTCPGLLPAILQSECGQRAAARGRRRAGRLHPQLRLALRRVSEG